MRRLFAFAAPDQPGGSYFHDKTLRMNDTSGATFDGIEPLALLTPN